MNVTAAGIDIHGIITFHITTASADVLNVAVNRNIAACGGQVLNVTIDLDADNVTLGVFASDGIPIDGLAISIPATIYLLDGVTLDGIGSVATPDVDRATLDDSTSSCFNGGCTSTMDDGFTA